jgi:uncharacterized protein (DUF4213/DUF364 family)
MSVIDDVLATLPEGCVQEVRIGAFWAAVVTEVGGRRRCGLATAMRGDDAHHHGGAAAVPDAGRLAEYSALRLAALARSESELEASVGVAAINSLLPAREEQWVDLNAEQVVVERGAGKRVAVIGHFPFIPRWRDIAGTLWVLEKRPRGEDLPADACAEVLPLADIVAISGTTLINHTFEELMTLCRPDALVLVLGGSTPLSPVMFDYGVHILSGSVVVSTDAVLRAVSEGANFRQVHPYGVRLVTMQRG